MRIPGLRIFVSLALLFPVLAIPLKSQRPATPAAKPAAIFEDVTRAAGIDFHLTCGTPKKLYIMDALCGGVAFLDYDQDGWLDILLVNGSTLEELKQRGGGGLKLYRNQGDGTFADVTAAAGLVRRGWGMGVAVGDYNNDGWPDFYVSYLSGGALFRNTGKGTFEDVTEAAGVGNSGRFGTSAAFGDYDSDGHLDLYVANYVSLDLDNLPPFGSGPNCQYRGIPVSCGPRGLTGSRDRLYRNNGDGTFSDVTEKLGIDPEAYYGLGVVWGDYNGDGRLDVYVANDSSPSLLYENLGEGKFREVGLLAGVAYSSDGREQAGMGVDFGDYDDDGRPDLVKTNFSDDSNNLYRNNGDGTFDDRAGATGLAPLDVPFLAFGARFLDFDSDGWRDLFIANGHVNPQVDAHKFGVTYAQRNFLYRNFGGRFEEIGRKAGPALAQVAVSRGAASGDFDNDGHVDLLVSNLDGQPQLLRNTAAGAGHRVQIKLVGSKSNRDGFGARVEVAAGDRTQGDEARASSSYLSAHDPRLHFGLGDATKVERIVVRWPSGTIDRVEGESADQELVVQEGRGVTQRRALPAREGPRPAGSK
jgi:hypothetical protein